jgi:hypothetical protein
VKIVDKNLPPTIGPRGGEHPAKVNVYEKDCLQKRCYRAHKDRGSFVNGRGYTSYNKNPEWVCITRHLHGCP